MLLISLQMMPVGNSVYRNKSKNIKPMKSQHTLCTAAVSLPYTPVSQQEPSKPIMSGSRSSSLLTFPFISCTDRPSPSRPLR